MFTKNSKHTHTHTHTHVQGRVVDGSNSHKKSVIKKQLRGTHQLVLLTSSCLYIVPGCPSRNFQVYSMHIQTSCDVIVPL